MVYVIHVYQFKNPRRFFMDRFIRRRQRTKKRIALALAAWRKRNKLSQSAAAAKLNISCRTLQEWEQGRATPHHLALDALWDEVAR
jgi:DNA-binding transcriptional regulator YiaG